MRRATVADRAFALVGVGIAANALRMRARIRRLPVLDDGDAAPAPALVAPAPVDGFGVVTAAGATVGDATVAAAVRHAESHGLDVVDLVPGDLPAARLIELATQVDPATYRGDKLAIGWGAGHAAVVRTSVLARLDLADRAAVDAAGGSADAGGERAGGPRRRDLDPVTYLRLARQLKRYAPTSTDLAVAPALAAVEPHPSWRIPYLRVLLGVTMPVLAPGPALGAALATAAPLLARRGGLVTLAAYLAEPHLVAGGRRAAGLRDALARPVRDVATVVRSLVASPTPEVRAHTDGLATADRERRALYADDARRADTFVEPRRATCPWCGSADIGLLHELPDLIQGKPGTFRLDECGACTHVFQNPRLSLAGLDHYYRDFYDGLQAEHTELLFSFTGASYTGRARMLERAVARTPDADSGIGPKRWLDVGTGHGHFCLVARDTWPETRFDGLDMTDSIDEAQRRGWVEHGHRGLLPDLAPDLAGGYDVVSMHHYLEHTRAPGLELDAARTVLEDGGHLLVELPAPESPLGRRLGWAWGPWFQPQHQHLIPLANLVAALHERDFTVVAVERYEAHQPVDLVFAVMLLAMRLAPAGSAPWDPPRRRLRQAGRAAVFTGLLPLAGAAMAADQALRPLVRARPTWSNTYRVLARKD
jgi:SAM-dependent methyltransferase